MANILITLPDGSEFDVELGTDTARIGRDAENEIALPDDSISTFHSEIRFEGGQYVVHDLGSTNGIRVNGERVSEAVLADGDLIRFGNIRAKFSGEALATPGAVGGHAAPRRVTAPVAMPAATPAPGANVAASGFGPKKSAKDGEKSLLVALAVLVVLVCVAAMAAAFTMKAG
jgi:pSer/pThr/pTyr-binding forkhead associated (FHA) protein